MKKNKVVIFDFDGTLADSLDLTLSAIQQLQDEFKLKPITRQQIRTQHLKDGLRLAGLSRFKLPHYIRKLKQLLRARTHELRSFSGIPEVIQELNRKLIPMAVVSSNAVEIIEQFLCSQKLQHCFEEICADSSVFGKHRVLKKFCNRHNLEPKQVLYVGDELRDVDAAERLAMPIVVVDWGWNHRDLFTAKRPDTIVSTPDEMLTAIQRWLD